MGGIFSVIVGIKKQHVHKINFLLLLKMIFSSGFIIFVLIQRKHKIVCMLQAVLSGSVIKEQTVAAPCAV